MTRGLPWCSILLQAPAAGLVMLGLIGADYVIATARWSIAYEAPPSDSPPDSAGVLFFVLLPVIIAGLGLVVGVPILVWAAIGTLGLFVVGLPLRVIRAAGAVWIRFWMPWALGAIGAALVLVAWFITPVPLEPPRSYTPSSPMFAVGLALTGFAVAHLWLPRLRRRDSAPRDRQLAQAPA